MSNKTNCDYCDGLGFEVLTYGVAPCHHCRGTGKNSDYEVRKTRATRIVGRYRVQRGGASSFYVDARSFDEVKARYSVGDAVLFVTDPDGVEKAYRSGWEIPLDCVGHAQ